jgi:hypothetical protein
MCAQCWCAESHGTAQPSTAKYIERRLLLLICSVLRMTDLITATSVTSVLAWAS